MSFDPRIRLGSFVVVTGPSKAGKTTFMSRLLKDSKHTMEREIDRLLIIAKHSGQTAYHELVESILHVIFFTPDKQFDEQSLLALLQGKSKGTAVIVDDMESEGLTNLLKVLVKIALRLAHHMSLTCFLSLHALYYSDNMIRLLQKNASYLVLFSSLRERASVINLGRQIFGDKGRNILREASTLARMRKYSPIIIDLTPQSHEAIRVRESFDGRKPTRTFQQLTPEKVSYAPYAVQEAAEEQKDKLISPRSYLTKLQLREPGDKGRMLRICGFIEPPVLFVEPETGIPVIDGQRLLTPITQLFSYFFDISFHGESIVDAKPPDSESFIKLLKSVKLPSNLLRMVTK